MSLESSSCNTNYLSAAASLQTTQASGISNAPQWPSNAMVQLADGRWVPTAQAPQQAPAAPADLSQGTGKASPYGVSASSQGEPKDQAPYTSKHIIPALMAKELMCLVGALTRPNAPCRRAVDAERCGDCFRACARPRVAQCLDVPSRVNQRREAAGLVPAQAAARTPSVPTGSCAPAHIRASGGYL